VPIPSIAVEGSRGCDPLGRLSVDDGVRRIATNNELEIPASIVVCEFDVLVIELGFAGVVHLRADLVLRHMPRMFAGKLGPKGVTLRRIKFHSPAGAQICKLEALRVNGRKVDHVLDEDQLARRCFAHVEAIKGCDQLQILTENQQG